MPRKGQSLESGSLKGGKSQPSSSDKPGEGGRFQSLTGKLSKQPGVKDPEALAAAIGRAKYGKRKFQKLSERAFLDGFYETLRNASSAVASPTLPRTLVPIALQHMKQLGQQGTQLREREAAQRRQQLMMQQAGYQGQGG